MVLHVRLAGSEHEHKFRHSLTTAETSEKALLKFAQCFDSKTVDGIVDDIKAGKLEPYKAM